MEKAKLDMENELAEIQVRVSGAGGGRDVMKNLPGHLGVSALQFQRYGSG